MLARTPSRQSNPGCVQHHVQPRASRLQHYNVCFLFRHALTRVQRAGYNASAVQHPPGVPARGGGAAARGDGPHCNPHCMGLQPLLRAVTAPAAYRLQPRLPTVAGAAARGARTRTRSRLHARCQAGAPNPHPGLSPNPSPNSSPDPNPHPNNPRCVARTPRARRSAATRPRSSRPRLRPTRRTMLVRRCCSGGSRRRTAPRWRRRCVLRRRGACLWRRRRRRVLRRGWAVAWRCYSRRTTARRLRRRRGRWLRSGCPLRTAACTSRR